MDSERPLARYLVLDLTDQRGELGPWTLAELGADVVKVEPPAGSAARMALPLGPTATDPATDTATGTATGPLASSALPAASLQFCAYNSNKRSIALDLAQPPTSSNGPSPASSSSPSPASSADRSVFEALVKRCDFIFSSEPDGFLSAAGYDHDALVELNPHIVNVQITPFGHSGPRANNPYSELTLAALGGSVNLQGVPERPPVKSSIPQVWRHAGVEAANAALIAHARRLATGQAQQAVVSAQAAVTWTLLNAMEAYAISGEDFHRTGSVVMLAAPLQLRLDANDGHVIVISRGAFIQNIVEWLIDEGIVATSWRDEDWATFDLRALSGQDVNYTFVELFEAVSQLCSRYSRDALMRKALAYRQTIAPIHTVADLLKFNHLRQRDFWSVAEPGCGLDGVELPGGPITIDNKRLAGARRPPLLDEHGQQIRADLTEPGRAETGLAETGLAETGLAEAGQAEPAEPAQGNLAAFAYGNSELPLAGIKVADFSWIGVGPITGKALADHGATVVRIECSTRMDGLRVNPPFKNNEVDPDMSHFYGTFNTSKLSLDIDLAVPAGLEIAKKMIAWADVVIESWRPGSFAAAGLTDEVMAELNPTAIVVHTSLLASGGPLSGIAGYGYHAAAIAGFYPVVGWPDLPPDGPYLAYTDTISPRFITAALLSALDYRRRTGQGCIIEAAQLECGLQFLAPELIDNQLSGYVATRKGNRDDDVAPQGVYRCAGDDRWCAITIASDEQWQALLKLLGEPGWAADPQLATLAGRQDAHDEIDKQLEDWTSGFPATELEQMLTAAGIAAGVVQRSSDLLADPQYAHQGFYHYLEHQRMGTVPYAGHQYRIAGYDSGPRSAAPVIGQHTFEVLTDLLGFDADEIAEVAAAGALG